MTAHQPSRLHIVILSCNYGGGHHQVAEVLGHELRQRSSGCRVEIYDYIETCIGHWFNVTFTSLYFGSVRWAPCLYRWFYQATSSISPHSPVQRFINSLGRRRFAAILQAQRPDIVVCTYCLVGFVLRRELEDTLQRLAQRVIEHPHDHQLEAFRSTTLFSKEATRLGFEVCVHDIGCHRVVLGWYQRMLLVRDHPLGRHRLQGRRWEAGTVWLSRRELLRRYAGQRR